MACRWAPTERRHFHPAAGVSPCNSIAAESEVDKNDKTRGGRVFVPLRVVLRVGGVCLKLIFVPSPPPASATTKPWLRLRISVDWF